MTGVLRSLLALPRQVAAISSILDALILDALRSSEVVDALLLDSLED